MRHVVEREDGRSGSISGCPGLRFGQADARHLRVGEHDGRHRCIVVAQAIAVQRVLGRNLRAIGSHIDELVLASHVAGRIR